MSVDIYIDESVPVAVAASLNRRGVTAISARDAGNLGISDKEQFAYATANRLLLFTHDTDFLPLAHRQNAASQDHWGIIYVHQHKLSIGECIRRLKEIADVFEQDDLKNHIEFL
jgi:predicted nuclease of predicted toxin-antitoxin system